jgi:hypothetical protein
MRGPERVVDFFFKKNRPLSTIFSFFLARGDSQVPAQVLDTKKTPPNDHSHDTKYAK